MNRSARAHCPWCDEWVRVDGKAGFARHVAVCPDAPERAKASYRIDHYTPERRR